MMLKMDVRIKKTMGYKFNMQKEEGIKTIL